jgi:hypothetical protein
MIASLIMIGGRGCGNFGVQHPLSTNVNTSRIATRIIGSPVSPAPHRKEPPPAMKLSGAPHLVPRARTPATIRPCPLV